MREFEYGGPAQVNGAAAQSYLGAFGPYVKRAENVLCKHFEVDELDISGEVWYPLPSFLSALEAFQGQFGRDFMRKIGRGVLKHVALPPGIDSIDKVMEMLDQAYNMNHQETGGAIGKYTWEKTGPQKGVMTCDNPYPCSFDLGLLETAARQFEPKATVRHDPDGSCRHEQGETCAYIIEW